MGWDSCEVINLHDIFDKCLDQIKQYDQDTLVQIQVDSYNARATEKFMKWYNAM